MWRTSSAVAAFVVAAAVGYAVSGPSRDADGNPSASQIRSVAKSFAAELANACPLADADDQRAFDVCRQSLFDSKSLPLASLVLWGTERKGKVVSEMELTQFNSEMWSGLYLSLWMFTGKWQVVYDEVEKQNVILLQTKFRNRLEHGQYPYPFWHSTAKWNDWQEATALKLHFDPSGQRIFALLRSKTGERVAGNYPDVAPHKFDGQWRWRGADGVVEPRVTLFAGLYSKNNPHLRDLERSYQDFANQMRRSTCSGCHVPDNPNKMRRLVLLQTPAHAAAEIERVIKTVREQKMPYAEWGEPAHLDPKLRAALLKHATRFQGVVEQAKTWEKEHQRSAEGRKDRRASIKRATQ